MRDETLGFHCKAINRERERKKKYRDRKVQIKFVGGGSMETMMTIWVLRILSLSLFFFFFSLGFRVFIPFLFCRMRGSLGDYCFQELTKSHKPHMHQPSKLFFPASVPHPLILGLARYLSNSSPYITVFQSYEYYIFFIYFKTLKYLIPIRSYIHLFLIKISYNFKIYIIKIIFI